MRRLALGALPAWLVAFGLVLEGCGEQQESPLGPTITTPTGAGDAVLQVDKERSAVDLGPAAVSARSMVGMRSVAASGATATSIPFGPEPGPFANSSGLFCDDCTQVGLPIGFSFSFFGSTYTTFSISTNGFIGFTPLSHSGCCSGGDIPSADALNNLIAAAWTDLDPGRGGGIFYETRGRAPSRYLVVAYQNLPWFGDEFGTNRVTTQIILYEGTNFVEIHTANQSAGHIYTQGVENATGTQAAFLPGRVAANYGLTNDGVRFTTAVSNTWAAKPAMLTARRGAAVGMANGSLYAIGGLNSAGTVLTTVQAYNPSTNAWSTKASLPAARQGNGAASIGGTLHLAGGNNAAGVPTRTLFSYNASTNTWSTRARMPVASGCGGSAVISGKLYVFSGCTRTSSGAQVAAGLLHRYDPSTNLWSTLRSAPAVHFQPAVGVISGKLYVVGGNTDAGVATGRLDVYNPATNTWSTRAAMPTARVAVAAAVVGGRLHVIGGRNGGTYLNTVEAYDPMTGSWAARAAMPTARAGLGVGMISQLLYAVGGRNDAGVLAINEGYTP